jgi:DNA-binding SARP family transcriptional activator
MGIRTRLFGGFSIQVNDVEISGLNSRHQILLAYLAIQYPKPVPRSTLAFTLWADSNEEQALTNLRKALHQIKQKLNNGEVIQIDSRTLQLNPKIQIDLTDFSTAMDSAELARRAKDVEAEQAALETASAFYRGDLLPNLYDDWLIPERDRLRDTFIRAMDRLIALLEARQHYRDAIQHAQRLLQTDKLREGTYRALIRLHALNNDRAAALNVYHTCAETLSKELGVEPDSSTRELYERLLRSDAQLSRINAPARPISTPLVARELEWKQLVTEWKKASNGELRTVLLSGEAGIGKTRLAEELLHWASRQGIHTAFAACYSAEGQISFGPVAEWLHGFSLENLDVQQRSELSRLLPELRGESTTPQPMTENWQKQLFFEAMARGVLGTNEPTVLFLDDIQWCDNDTLAWLRYFLHFDRKAKVLVLVTLRAEELPANNELQLLLIDLRAEGRLTEMELSRLDEKQTGELGSHLLGMNFSEAEAATLFLESEGVPLFVVEMANAGVRVESNLAVGAGTGARDAKLPPRLQAVLEGHLARLSSPARAVIESAAVIGREFDFGLLRKVSELDEGVTVNALDELWRLRMIRERGGDYDFSHDKLREATLANISPIRLRWLHQRAGEALETELENLGYPRIAEHFERAGLQKKALEYYVRAAGQAEHLFAFNEALDLLNHAVLLETKHASLANLHEQRGDLLKMLDRREDAFQTYAQAHNLSEDVLQKARVSRNQSTLMGRFNLEIARQKYQATLDDLRKAQNKPGYWLEWIEAQLAWIEICYWAQNGREVSDLLEQIKTPVERHGTVLQKLTYRTRLISSAFINERYRMNQSHLSLAQETIELAIEAGIPHQVSSAKRQFAMVALCANQLEVAEAAFREVISLCRQNGDMNSILIARTYLSLTHRRQRKLQEVIADTDLLEQKLEQASHNPAYRGVVQANRAWLAYQSDELENAQQLAQSALDVWRNLENPYPLHSLALFLLFAIAVQEENADEAFVCARAMLAPPQWKLTLEVESALLAALEADPTDRESSLRLCREAAEKAKQAGYL